MATLRRSEWWGGGVLALVALAMPIVLLMPNAVPAGKAEPSVSRPLSPPPPPSDPSLFSRTLFAPAMPQASAGDMPDDAPQLTGVAGRIGRDAVAIVRTGADTTRSLSPGDSVDGWRLVSIAADAAYFSRGGRQLRVPLPSDDDQ